jgi:flavin reductase (DIM6/NTAB) family NADH-FMN oxidoreductase RutF
LLARRQARLTARRPGAVAMDFADLKALNVFYMMPRPVYLVTVIDEGGDNLFPMDLVGPLGDELFLLALRRTSPSIAPMREGRRIVLSGMPARLKEAVYRLGAHHKEAGIDWRALELATRPSPLFGWPVPADALDGRELEVLQSEAIGSHVLFVTRVAGQARFGDEPQLCHVSDMYARWRSAQCRPFADA